MVEIPDDAVEAAERALCNQHHAHPLTDEEWAMIRRELSDGTDQRVNARLAVEAAAPPIAARVRAEALAGERQRWERLVQAHMSLDGVGGPDQAARNSALRQLLAAGSVPVATPDEDPSGCPACGASAPSLQAFISDPCQDDFHSLPVVPVATPTEPVLAEDDFIDTARRVLAGRGIEVARSDVGRVYDELRRQATATSTEPARCWCRGAMFVSHQLGATDCDGAASPVPAEQPEPWFRETHESPALLEAERAEVAAVEAAAEQLDEQCAFEEQDDCPRHSPDASLRPVGQPEER